MKMDYSKSNISSDELMDRVVVDLLSNKTDDELGDDIYELNQSKNESDKWLASKIIEECMKRKPSTNEFVKHIQDLYTKKLNQYNNLKPIRGI